MVPNIRPGGSYMDWLFPPTMISRACLIPYFTYWQSKPAVRSQHQGRNMADGGATSPKASGNGLSLKVYRNKCKVPTLLRISRSGFQSSSTVHFSSGNLEDRRSSPAM